MKIGTKEFHTENRTYIMGILNLTPDSFSDGGKWNRMDAALSRAEQMIKEGADILDLGGESTRPGYTPVSQEEEIERTVPVIEQIRRNFDIPLSIDTYKSGTAKACLAAGADMVNDIWGLKHDTQMAGVIAQAGAACCLMHNRNEAVYKDFLSDFMEDMQECIRIARDASIPGDKIILDPGVGFGKTYEMNLEIIREVGQMQSLGYPVLLGTSRKSVIGLTLDLPADQREEGTLVTTVFGMMNGCSFVRVHDVKANRRAIQMMEAINPTSIKRRV